MANVPANRAVTDEIRTTEATGTTDETTNSNGVASFLGDVRDGLAGIF